MVERLLYNYYVESGTGFEQRVQAALRDCFANCPHYEPESGNNFRIMDVPLTFSKQTDITIETLGDPNKSAHLRQNTGTWQFVMAWSDSAFLLQRRDALGNMMVITKDLNNNPLIVSINSTGIKCCKIGPSYEIYTPWSFSVSESLAAGQQIILPTYWKNSSNVIEPSVLARGVYSCNTISGAGLEYQEGIYVFSTKLIFKF